MTILMTGASGGFGRFFSGWLRAHHDETLVSTSRSVSPPEEGHIPCDVSDAKALDDLIRRVRPRLIFHLAASYSNHFEIDQVVNALAARTLIESCLRHCAGTRVVLVGSAAEYGIVLPAENPIAESRVLRPVSVYGMTKANQTHFGIYYAHQHKADVVIGRIFNLLVPGLSDRLFVGRAERLIDRFRAGDIDTIEVGHLGNQRDFVSGQDAAHQLNAIAHRGASGEIYHVASGRATLVREVLHTLLANASVPYSAVKEGTAVRTDYDPPVVYADMARTRALLDPGA